MDPIEFGRDLASTHELIREDLIKMESGKISADEYCERAYENMQMARDYSTFLCKRLWDHKTPPGLYQEVEESPVETLRWFAGRKGHGAEIAKDLLIEEIDPAAAKFLACQARMEAGPGIIDLTRHLESQDDLSSEVVAEALVEEVESLVAHTRDEVMTK